MSDIAETTNTCEVTPRADRDRLLRTDLDRETQKRQRFGAEFESLRAELADANVRIALMMLAEPQATINKLMTDLAAERERADKWKQKASRRSQLMAMLTEERNQIDKQRKAVEATRVQAEAGAATMRAERDRLRADLAAERERAERAERAVQNAIDLLGSGACDKHLSELRRMDFPAYKLREDERGCHYCWWDRADAAEAAQAQVEAACAAMRAILQRAVEWTHMRAIPIETLYDVLSDAEELLKDADAGREWLAVADRQHRHMDFLALLNHRTHSTDGSEYRDCPHSDCRYSTELLARWSAVRRQQSGGAA